MVDAVPDQDDSQFIGLHAFKGVFRSPPVAQKHRYLHRLTSLQQCDNKKTGD
jgi:hypothetical protein